MPALGGVHAGITKRQGAQHSATLRLSSARICMVTIWLLPGDAGCQWLYCHSWKSQPCKNALSSQNALNCGEHLASAAGLTETSLLLNL